MKFNIRFSGEMNIKVKDVFELERKLEELSEYGACYNDIIVYPEEEPKEELLVDNQLNIPLGFGISPYPIPYDNELEQFTNTVDCSKPVEVMIDDNEPF